MEGDGGGVGEGFAGSEGDGVAGVGIDVEEKAEFVKEEQFAGAGVKFELSLEGHGSGVEVEDVGAAISANPEKGGSGEQEHREKHGSHEKEVDDNGEEAGRRHGEGS